MLSKLRPFYLFLLLNLLTACGQDYNSNSFDASRYSASRATGTQQFINFYEVMSDKCISCHTGTHSHWADFITAPQWQTSWESNLVLPGDPSNSTIVSRLSGWSPGGDMPKNFPSISASDYQIIVDWINSL